MTCNSILTKEQLELATKFKTLCSLYEELYRDGYCIGIDCGNIHMKPEKYVGTFGLHGSILSLLSGDKYIKVSKNILGVNVFCLIMDKDLLNNTETGN